jgi:hypothetical protein
MTPVQLFTLAAATLAGAAALAQETGILTYPEFEVAVPHIDLSDCPPDLAAGDVFCRLTLNSDALHVFAFETEGDQTFVAMRSYAEGEFELSFAR